MDLTEAKRELAYEIQRYRIREQSARAEAERNKRIADLHTQTFNAIEEFERIREQKHNE